MSKERNIKPASKVARTCVYDPQRDIEKVVSGLSPDINDMLRTGVVFSGSVDSPDNGIDDPAAVIGLIRDEFAAIDAMRIVKKYGKKPAKVATAMEEAAEVGAPAPSNE